MRISFKERLLGPDAKLAFQTIKAKYGIRQFMRIPLPENMGDAAGPSSFAYDIISWECHLNPQDKRLNPKHVYWEKINLWWSIEYRKYIEKAFTRLYDANGVCGCVEVEKGEWSFFGWYDEAMEQEAEHKEAA